MGLGLRDFGALTLAILIAAGYLAGSIPTGYWLVRVLKHADIRTLGSGNIGGTNVWRVYGWRYGLPVIFLDTLKGFAPALIATLVDGHLAGVLAGTAAMLGHYRPLFMGFQKGGKIVATTGGAFFGVAPVVGGIAACIFLLVLFATRYVSLASIVGGLSLPIIAVLLDEPWPVIAFAGGAAVGIVLLHRPNITRLRDGTESRFVFRRSKAVAH